MSILDYLIQHKKTEIAKNYITEIDNEKYHASLIQCK